MKEAIYSALAQPSFQPLYRRLTGYLLRLQGYNNYPPQGGEVGISGEEWFINEVLSGRVAVCLDVGANKGSYARALLTNTNASVYAIEPIPVMVEQAIAATKEFGDRCQVIQCALSDHAGKVQLRYRRDQTEAASLCDEVGNEVYQADEIVDVELTTIDSLVGQLGLSRVDFIKLDVEGLELACLKGAKKTIETLQPAFIQVEMHWHHIFTGTTLHALHMLLAGYHVYRLLPNGVVPTDPRTTLDNVFAFSNYVFSRERLELLLR